MYVPTVCVYILVILCIYTCTPLPTERRPQNSYLSVMGNSLKEENTSIIKMEALLKI